MLFLGKKANSLLCRYMKSESATLGEVINKLACDIIDLIIVLFVVTIISPLLIAMYVEDIKNIFIRRLLECVEIIILLNGIKCLIIHYNMVSTSISIYNYILAYWKSVTLNEMIYILATILAIISIVTICKYLSNLEVAHCARKDK